MKIKLLDFIDKHIVLIMFSVGYASGFIGPMAFHLVLTGKP